MSRASLEMFCDEGEGSGVLLKVVVGVGMNLDVRAVVEVEQVDP